VHSSGYTGPDRSITTLVSSTRWQNITALVPPSHRLSSDERLDRFILHYLRLDGARALRYLKHHPDSAYTAQGLWQALSGLCIDPLEEPAAEDESEPGSTDALVESSIPVTDEHCLREIERELGRLLRQSQRLQEVPILTQQVRKVVFADPLLLGSLGIVDVFVADRLTVAVGVVDVAKDPDTCRMRQGGGRFCDEQDLFLGPLVGFFSDAHGTPFSRLFVSVRKNYNGNAGKKIV